jgi:hypothetical protein
MSDQSFEERPPAEAAGRTPIVVGVLAGAGISEQLAHQVEHDLPPLLRQRHPEHEWEVRLRIDPMLGTPGTEVDLIGAAREWMRQEGCRFAICLTDLPLHAGRRPLTAQASVVLGVGLLSVPALGAVDVAERTLDAMLGLIDTLLRPEAAPRRRRLRPTRGRRAGTAAALPNVRDMASPLGRLDTPEEGTVRYVAAPAAGTIRLVLGLVRSNQPWRFIIGLSRALVASLGVGAFGLTSPAIWQIADAMSWLRLLVVAVGSLVAITLTVIVAHGLWDRRAPLSLHDPVSLINLATAITVSIGVLTMFAALLVITAVCGVALIPQTVLSAQIKHAAPGIDYLRIGWVVTSLATIGGALGAALESDLAVHEAAYGLRAADQDDEAGNG